MQTSTGSVLELCCSAECLVLLGCAPATVKGTIHIQANHCCGGICELLHKSSQKLTLLLWPQMRQCWSCIPSSKVRASAPCARSSAGASDRLCSCWGALGNLACGSATLGTRPESASRVGVRFAEMECALYHVRSHRLCPSGSCTDSLKFAYLLYLMIIVRFCRPVGSSLVELLESTHLRCSAAYT